jgi:hypothetical protein
MPTLELLLLYSLMKKDKKNLTIILVSEVILNVFIWLFPNYVFLVSALIHIIIVLEIVSKFLIQLYNRNEINLFLILLIAYELSNSFKNLVMYIDLINGLIFFFINSTLQIIFGIIFMFININKKTFRLNESLLK